MLAKAGAILLCLVLTISLLFLLFTFIKKKPPSKVGTSEKWHNNKNDRIKRQELRYFTNISDIGEVVALVNQEDIYNSKAVYEFPKLSNYQYGLQGEYLTKPPDIKTTAPEEKELPKDFNQIFDAFSANPDKVPEAVLLNQEEQKLAVSTRIPNRQHGTTPAASDTSTLEASHTNQTDGIPQPSVIPLAVGPVPFEPITPPEPSVNNDLQTEPNLAFEPDQEPEKSVSLDQKEHTLAVSPSTQHRTTAVATLEASQTRNDRIPIPPTVIPVAFGPFPFEPITTPKPAVNNDLQTEPNLVFEADQEPEQSVSLDQKEQTLAGSPSRQHRTTASATLEASQTRNNRIPIPPTVIPVAIGPFPFEPIATPEPAVNNDIQTKPNLAFKPDQEPEESVFQNEAAVRKIEQFVYGPIPYKPNATMNPTTELQNPPQTEIPIIELPITERANGNLPVAPPITKPSTNSVQVISSSNLPENSIVRNVTERPKDDQNLHKLIQDFDLFFNAFPEISNQTERNDLPKHQEQPKPTNSVLQPNFVREAKSLTNANIDCRFEKCIHGELDRATEPSTENPIINEDTTAAAIKNVDCRFPNCILPNGDFEKTAGPPTASPSAAGQDTTTADAFSNVDCRFVNCILPNGELHTPRILAAIDPDQPTTTASVDCRFLNCILPNGELHAPKIFEAATSPPSLITDQNIIVDAVSNIDCRFVNCILPNGELHTPRILVAIDPDQQTTTASVDCRFLNCILPNGELHSPTASTVAASPTPILIIEQEKTTVDAFQNIDCRFLNCILPNGELHKPIILTAIDPSSTTEERTKIAATVPSIDCRFLNCILPNGEFHTPEILEAATFPATSSLTDQDTTTEDEYKRIDCRFINCILPNGEFYTPKIFAAINPITEEQAASAGKVASIDCRFLNCILPNGELHTPENLLAATLLPSPITDKEMTTAATEANIDCRFVNCILPNGELHTPTILSSIDPSSTTKERTTTEGPVPNIDCRFLNCILPNGDPHTPERFEVATSSAAKSITDRDTTTEDADKHIDCRFVNCILPDGEFHTPNILASIDPITNEPASTAGAVASIDCRFLNCILPNGDLHTPESLEVATSSAAKIITDHDTTTEDADKHIDCRFVNCILPDGEFHIPNILASIDPITDEPSSTAGTVASIDCRFLNCILPNGEFHTPAILEAAISPAPSSSTDQDTTGAGAEKHIDCRFVNCILPDGKFHTPNILASIDPITDEPASTAGAVASVDCRFLNCILPNGQLHSPTASMVPASPTPILIIEQDKTTADAFENIDCRFVNCILPNGQFHTPRTATGTDRSSITEEQPTAADEAKTIDCRFVNCILPNGEYHTATTLPTPSSITDQQETIENAVTSIDCRFENCIFPNIESNTPGIAAATSYIRPIAATPPPTPYSQPAPPETATQSALPEESSVDKEPVPGSFDCRFANCIVPENQLEPQQISATTILIRPTTTKPIVTTSSTPVIAANIAAQQPISPLPYYYRTAPSWVDPADLPHITSTKATTTSTTSRRHQFIRNATQPSAQSRYNPNQPRPPIPNYYPRYAKQNIANVAPPSFFQPQYEPNPPRPPIPNYYPRYGKQNVTSTARPPVSQPQYEPNTPPPVAQAQYNRNVPQPPVPQYYQEITTKPARPSAANLQFQRKIRENVKTAGQPPQTEEKSTQRNIEFAPNALPPRPREPVPSGSLANSVPARELKHILHQRVPTADKGPGNVAQPQKPIVRQRVPTADKTPENVAERQKPKVEDLVQDFHSFFNSIPEKPGDIVQTTFPQVPPGVQTPSTEVRHPKSIVRQRVPTVDKNVAQQRKPIVHQRVPTSEKASGNVAQQRKPTVHQRVPDTNKGPRNVAPHLKSIVRQRVPTADKAPENVAQHGKPIVHQRVPDTNKGPRNVAPHLKSIVRQRVPTADKAPENVAQQRKHIVHQRVPDTNKGPRNVAPHLKSIVRQRVPTADKAPENVVQRPKPKVEDLVRGFHSFFNSLPEKPGDIVQTSFPEIPHGEHPLVVRHQLSNQKELRNVPEPSVSSPKVRQNIDNSRVSETVAPILPDNIPYGEHPLIYQYRLRNSEKVAGNVEHQNTNAQLEAEHPLVVQYRHQKTAVDHPRVLAARSSSKTNNEKQSESEHPLVIQYRQSGIKSRSPQRTRNRNNVNRKPQSIAQTKARPGQDITSIFNQLSTDAVMKHGQTVRQNPAPIRRVPKGQTSVAKTDGHRLQRPAVVQTQQLQNRDTQRASAVQPSRNRPRRPTPIPRRNRFPQPSPFDSTSYYHQPLQYIPAATVRRPQYQQQRSVRIPVYRGRREFGKT